MKQLAENILQLRDVTVEFGLDQGVLRAVDRASLDIKRGEILGIVGESGCGKSTLAFSILNLVAPPGKITNGQIIYGGEDLLRMSDQEIREFRWNDLAMVFQAAQNSMNPVIRIKEHFLETAAAHNSKVSEDEVIAKARQLMEYVRLEADQVLDSYPHQLSGGMKQRTIIAMSLLLDPRILILDEPTTALDVITQAYIMDMLRGIRTDLGITMIFLTHDVSIMGKIADRMAVMYAGQVVELGTVDNIFYNSLHPYTSGLMRSAPSLTDDVTKRRSIPGSPPDLLNLPPGCRFAERCRFHQGDLCSGAESGELAEVKPGHFTTCLEWERLDA